MASVITSIIDQYCQYINVRPPLNVGIDEAIGGYLLDGLGEVSLKES